MYQINGCPKCLDNGEQVSYNITKTAKISKPDKIRVRMSYKCKKGHTWHEVVTTTWTKNDTMILTLPDDKEDDQQN